MNAYRRIPAFMHGAIGMQSMHDEKSRPWTRAFVGAMMDRHSPVEDVEGCLVSRSQAERWPHMRPQT